jgi:O-antigen/teichoic acid export membrane protein
LLSLKKLLKIQTSNTKHRLIHGISWGVLGGAVSKALFLISNIILARFLGKTSFGEYGIIQNTVGMFGVFAGLGLGLTATKYVAQYKFIDPAKAGKILSISMLLAMISGIIMSIILLLLAPYIATTTLNAPQLTQGLRISSLTLFFGAVSGAQTGAIYGFEAFKKISLVNIITGVLCIPITFLCVWLWSFSGAIWAGAVILMLNCVFNHFLLLGECRNNCLRLKMNGCWSEWPIVLKYSLPATMTGIMVAPVTWIVSTILVNKPNGYAELGVFNAANQWRTVLIFIPTIIGQIITPIMSERLGIGGNSTAIKILKSSMIVSALSVIPIAAIMSFLSKWIMHQYGAAFSEGWSVLLVVLATVTLLAIQTPVANLIVASGRMWLGTFMNAGWGIVVIVSTMLLSDLGALGLALAFLIGYMFHSIWTFWFAWRKLSET